MRDDNGDISCNGDPGGAESPSKARLVPVVEVEVVQKEVSSLGRAELEREVEVFVRQRQYINSHVKLSDFSGGLGSSVLAEHVDYLTLCPQHEDSGEEMSNRGLGVHLPSVQLLCRLFKLHKQGPEVEEICSEGEEEVPAAQHWLLPAQEFQGCWENLVYSTDIKQELLRYVETALLLSDRGVDPHIVGCNRVVLLHGPPGTGKTSLCKALAQKLSIRLSHKYASSQLVEINSHSLFSKWFSESGKLVQKMFTEIKRLMEDPRSLVCVLIDEVESLTAARKSSGAEPSDAMRVVNALLTQLDSIKNHPNVLILTTSNITGAIDLAFVDRADIKQYVGPPSQEAVYSILVTCVQELVGKGLVAGEQQLLTARELRLTGLTPGPANTPSLCLMAAAGEAAKLQFSGRTLRKIPFLALAASSASRGPVSTQAFLENIHTAIQRQARDREELGKP